MEFENIRELITKNKVTEGEDRRRNEGHEWEVRMTGKRGEGLKE